MPLLPCRYCRVCLCFCVSSISLSLSLSLNAVVGRNAQHGPRSLVRDGQSHTHALHTRCTHDILTRYPVQHAHCLHVACINHLSACVQNACMCACVRIMHVCVYTLHTRYNHTLHRAARTLPARGVHISSLCVRVWKSACACACVRILCGCGCAYCLCA